MKHVLYDWAGLNMLLFHVIHDVRFGALETAMSIGSQLGRAANFPLYLAMTALAGAILASRAETAHPGRSHLTALKWLQAITVFATCYLLEAWLVPALMTWFDYPRPFMILPPDLVHLIGPPESTSSLPSGHATFAMAVAASLWPLANSPARAGLVLFVVWVGISRVSLGVHFPADVLAGYTLSLAIVWLLRFALKRLAPPLIS